MPDKDKGGHKTFSDGTAGGAAGGGGGEALECTNTALTETEEKKLTHREFEFNTFVRRRNDKWTFLHVFLNQVDKVLHLLRDSASGRQMLNVLEGFVN